VVVFQRVKPCHGRLWLEYPFLLVTAFQIPPVIVSFSAIIISSLLLDFPSFLFGEHSGDGRLWLVLPPLFMDRGGNTGCFRLGGGQSVITYKCFAQICLPSPLLLTVPNFQYVRYDTASGKKHRYGY